MLDANSIVGTERTEKLCREIAQRSDGVCTLGFSRGKDSVAAFLWLRKFFKQIIPYHVASVPHLGIVDRSIAYYEDYFGVKIERFMCGECMECLFNLYFQTPDREKEIDNLGVVIYSKQDLCELLRKKYNAPKAWNAFGINASDSIQRRVRIMATEGKNETNLSFYPCYDWSRKQIVGLIEQEGIRLCPDYRLANRSVAGIPSYRWFKNMEALFPDDYRKVLNMYPLAEALLAKQYFRRQHFGVKAEAE